MKTDCQTSAIRSSVPFTDVTLLHGDVLGMLASLDDNSVGATVTSPPYYGLRDYGVDGQYGLEPTPEAYAERLVGVGREIARVMRFDGTLWLNLGDTYGGGGIARPTGKWPTTHDPADRNNGKRRSFAQEKCLLGIPGLVERAMVDDGWVVRNRIVWAKPRPIPSNGRDRLDSQHEIVLLLVRRQGRRPAYRFDKRALAEAGDVWLFPTDRSSKHNATFPVDLPARCIALSGLDAGDVVLDPFMGSGTTGVAAMGAGCSFVGIDLVAGHVAEASRRLSERAA